MKFYYKHRRILFLGLSLGAALLLWRASLPAQLPSATAQEPPPEIFSTAYCSAVKPGVSYLEVRWRIAGQPLTGTALSARVSQSQLETTVYADGFEKGLFARVDAVRPKALFRTATSAPLAGGRRQKPLPGLSNLRLAEVGTRGARPAPEALRLLDFTTPQDGPEWVVVRLEGVEPGLEYTFRVPDSQQTTTATAAVCPVDSPRQPARKGKAAQPKPGF
jgi:hypothetical protein